MSIQIELIESVQLVCEEPFTYEMELDDLPKERLKELIWQEAELHYKRMQEEAAGGPTGSEPMTS